MAAFPSYVCGDLFVCLRQGFMTIPFALNIFMASGCFNFYCFMALSWPCWDHEYFTGKANYDGHFHRA